MDLSDIEQGLKELKEFKDLTYKANADLPETYYTRLFRLHDKRDMFLKRYHAIDVHDYEGDPLSGCSNCGTDCVGSYCTGCSQQNIIDDFS